MTIIATIIVLGVLIFVHELGHFVAAKMVGVDVQRFSIGLGPRVWGFDRGGTEYVLSAIPLGGYVKMAGMGDEMLEKIEGGPVSDEPREAGPGDFDAKPLWARAFVISAGVIMNFAFAFVAYAAIAGFWGFQDAASTRVGDVVEGLLPPGAESLAGIPDGAEIVSIGDRPTEDWGDVRTAILELGAGPTRFVLASPSVELDARIPDSEEERRRLATALRNWMDAGIGAVNPGSPADDGGIEAGDRILAVDGTPVAHWYEFQRAIQERPETRTEIRVERDGAELVRVVTPDRQTVVDPVTGGEREVGAIGVAAPPYDVVYSHASAGEAIVYGWRQTVYVTELIFGFLVDLFTGDVSPRSMGSIVTIGQASGQAAEAGFDIFIGFMALFSINLAILNLLPIPILDGGHLLFLAIEAVRGKALSVEQRLRWSNVGFLIVMGIMIFALGNDFLRLFGL